MLNRLRSFLILSCVLLVSATAYSQDLAKPVSKVTLADGDSIVFLGDSITHQCLYTQYVEDFLYTRFPTNRFKIHNAGVGGARAWDALARFDADVAAYKPKYVTILLGMNDGSYQPFNQDIFDTYKQDMTELLSRLDSIGAISIPMTPTMFDSRASVIGKRERDPAMLREYNSVLTYYGTWLRELATDEGRGFVDMWGPLNNITFEQRKQDANFTLIKDAVHPDAPGQVVMAAAIITDLGFPRQVSNIRVSADLNGDVNATATGGKVTNILITDDTVSFSWKANSLPWVVPAEAQPGAVLTKLGHKLSKESLEVHGLAPGKYQLKIDDKVVGVYTNVQLARHIELQENAKTPQHQQATYVAELNKQRNAGPVRSMRGQWSQFQRYARSKRAAEADLKNEAAVAELEKWTEQIKGMDNRVAEFNAAAKLIEDEIYKTNQPISRKYVIKKVK
ncbi:MAG: SGNH/GDSL hydrolase family protein [Planctomycetaceae bacterium]|jgi:lysophospholipase L1-like esterase|nr:SGNH/GDSL hydrolase family protein [Planctomycetaceae bacterium]MDC0273220.1 SGNH/GDSL hydrolase family protein [Planctomycetaceae bacterium]MDG2391755.1 SGNH/GDSL hydrolase family protein [Planctomycetaceae bacterium]